MTAECSSDGEYFAENEDASPWVISLTMLWQKAHSKLILMARNFRTKSSMFLNLLLFRQLHPCCESQPRSYDTATFVQMHPSEAV